ncbi:acetyltransferase [Murimonas intestini]|uniref:acetyltransferase n=1 Tax=Murimonas intestini TaxID=1337051 RepID=UPI0011DE0CFA|nr:acetyltransferase [Murimonas intestini]
MKKNVVLIGAGGHCKILIESLDKEKYEIIGILDERTYKGTLICNVPVIGTDKDAEEIFANGTHYAVITVVGNLQLRKILIKKYRKIGYQFPNIVHKTCRISESVTLGNGVTLLANSCINAEAKLEDFVTINTGAIVEHEVSVGENSHIAPGTILLGGSQIGKNTMIGAGSVILQQLKIGNDCSIGAGSIVLKSIADGKTAYGNPAKEK